MRAAVIIKHPFRDNDIRIDIYEVPEDMPQADLKTYAEGKMLGPFEVIGISCRVSNSELNPRYDYAKVLPDNLETK